MDANGFIEDERGVTPVIGIILIVAIAVVLAAVVGTSLIDTGNKRTTTAPQVSFEFDYDADGSDSTLNVTHRSGDPVENPSTVLTVAGDESPSIDTIEDGGDDELNSGDTIVIDLGGELSDGDEVRIVWEDPDTDTTTVIARYEFGG